MVNGFLCAECFVYENLHFNIVVAKGLWCVHIYMRVVWVCQELNVGKNGEHEVNLF